MARESLGLSTRRRSEMQTYCYLWLFREAAISYSCFLAFVDYKRDV